VLAFILTPRLGIQGMAYSRLLAMTVTPIFILIVERIAFGRCLWEFWRRIILSLGAVGVLTGLTQYLLLRSLPPGWLWFLLAIGASGVVFALMLLATRYMDAAEQKWLRSFVAKVVVS
jgi:membrane associated rhomboid family serine protease